MSAVLERAHDNAEGARLLQQYAPLVSKYTNKFHSRVMALRGDMDEEDVRQELQFILLRCRKSYDETKGGSFLNFVISAFFNEMNTKMRREQSAIDHGLRRIDVYEFGDSGDCCLWDSVDSGQATPEQNLEAMSCLQHALDRLSDQARAIVETLVSPPDEVCRQFELRERGTEIRREAGVGQQRSGRTLNMKFLFDLFQVPIGAQRKLAAEIQAKVGLAFGI